jgi:hypothetical protein
MASPHLVGFGQRTQLLACLSLWLDRTLALAAELPSVPLEMQLYAEEDDGWLSLYLTTMYRCCRCATPTPPMPERPRQRHGAAADPNPGRHHRGAIELASRPQGGTCLTLRFPLFNTLTGGEHDP